MPEEKAKEKRIKAQIQEGFFPQRPPVISGSLIAEDEKEKIDEGFVPQKQPVKPSDKGDKGFVPPPPPKKPPEKPDKGKK